MKVFVKSWVRWPGVLPIVHVTFGSANQKLIRGSHDFVTLTDWLKNFERKNFSLGGLRKYRVTWLSHVMRPLCVRSTELTRGKSYDYNQIDCPEVLGPSFDCKIGKHLIFEQKITWPISNRSKSDKSSAKLLPEVAITWPRPKLIAVMPPGTTGLNANQHYQS